MSAAWPPASAMFHLRESKGGFHCASPHASIVVQVHFLCCCSEGAAELFIAAMTGQVHVSVLALVQSWSLHRGRLTLCSKTCQSTPFETQGQILKWFPGENKHWLWLFFPNSELSCWASWMRSKLLRQKWNSCTLPPNWVLGSACIRLKGKALFGKNHSGLSLSLKTWQPS